MISIIKLICLGTFLTGLISGKLAQNADSSSTGKEKQQHSVIKEYFREEFDDGDEWQKRWVQSKHRSDYGKFRIGAGRFYGDREKDKGLQATQDTKYYAVSARFRPFSNEGQTLVLQYTVKYDQHVDCGGAYIKLFHEDLNQEVMNEDSPYYIMFGPDICGEDKKIVQVIFNYKDDYYFIKKNITCETDDFTHLYTLIVRPDLTYEVKIDNYVAESGNLEDDWDFLPPRKIVDADMPKPDYWDERERIEDPMDKKPDDWEQPERIPDPDVQKPDDWDEEMDGEWSPPLIPNPEYKGIWKPRIIKNPNYNGIWVQPEVDNPEYTPDPDLYKYFNISVIGLEILQGRSGTIFNNFLITNDEQYAEDAGNEMWGATYEREWKRRDGQDVVYNKINEKQEPKGKDAKKEKKGKDLNVKDEL
ncbi:calreticulin-like isoform X1 [Sceloporus undulatus]|uniref:calreticulin-like isoform X1 n=1 Tax=Sceloporus undulatus TaxID=8520 RepID=UPI001C4B6934|nr:calreticulin-like isoform X1 [Sceloporus undulatus]